MDTNPVVLPEGWVEYYDEASGAPYYYNTNTQETSWELPTREVQELTIKEEEPIVSTEDEGEDAWEECYDEEGYLYYWNKNTGESRWEKPESQSGIRKWATKPRATYSSTDYKQLVAEKESEQRKKEKEKEAPKEKKKSDTFWSAKPKSSSSVNLTSTTVTPSASSSTAPPPTPPKPSTSFWSKPKESTSSSALPIDEPPAKPLNISAPVLTSKPNPIVAKKRPVGDLPPVPTARAVSSPSLISTSPTSLSPPAVTSSSTSSNTSNSASDNNKCTHCGTPATSKFCTNCGKKIEAAPPKAEPPVVTPPHVVKPSPSIPIPSASSAGIKCPKCGLTSSSKFCTGCGTKLEAIPPRGPLPPPPTVPTSSPPSSTSNVELCPNCKTPRTSKFCTECGHKFDATAPTKSQSSVASTSPPAGSRSDLRLYMASKNIDSRLIDILVQQGVTLDNMKELTADTLKEFGINIWGDRTAIMGAIKSY